MATDKITRSSYLTKHVGQYPAGVEIMGRRYVKVEDLRYGTNPHQTAAFYRPIGTPGVIGGMTVLKTGKNGLSQTNLEDISYSLNIAGEADVKTCAMPIVHRSSARGRSGSNPSWGNSSVQAGVQWIVDIEWPSRPSASIWSSMPR